MALSHDSTVTRQHVIDVLVVDGSHEAQEQFAQAVRHDGYRVHFVSEGDEAVDALRAIDPDVVLLDPVLPGADGFEVCRRMRTISDAYIIMVTARADEIDKVIGLAIGADDYLEKPFSSAELVARIGAMLRRPRGGVLDHHDGVRRLARLSIDPIGREVHVDGSEVALTRIEFELLAALTDQPTAVRSRADLLATVWGPNWVGDDHLVDVHIANLRKKIDLDGASHIRTVRGVGYRMESDSVD